MTDIADRPVSHYPDDPELLYRVLRPYRAKKCEYLRTAQVTVEGEPFEHGRLTVDCTFEISESCYIDDTGHFNSVEFNICYNQMAYFAVAKCVQDRLIEPFSRWSMDDFWARQLGNILITDFRSAFRVEMHGRLFRGELEITDVAAWDGTDLLDPLVVLKTRCHYWDEHGGDSFGEVSAAITNPPPLGS